MKHKHDRPPRREPLEPLEAEKSGESRPSAPSAKELLAGRIVSRRSEGGVPYPGDFPNPLPGKYRGCF
ncbi:MAG: hypothetical protein ABJD07_10935 [Gemmatimonadaceae bacterium]